MLWLLLEAVGVFAGFGTPEQIRLSFTEHPNEMRVTWVTFSPITSYVYYRKILCDDNSDWKRPIKAKQETFYTGDWSIRVQYIHTAVIKNIDKSCVYEYYTGSWMGTSSTYRFKGRTPSDDDLEATDIIIVADWGGSSIGQYTKELLMQQLKIKKIDAILHAGDFAYDLHTLEGQVGDSFLSMIEPIVATHPYMTIPGNHENHNNRTHYKARFKMPVSDENQGTGYFYSFNIGRAHYVMINTETYLDGKHYFEALTQTNWLKKDLQKANTERNIRPWIVVLTHRNLYCSVDWKKPYKARNSDCGLDALALKKELEEILHSNKVDLFMQAHVHQYERTTPIYKNQTSSGVNDTLNYYYNPNATVYITNGNAGNIEGHNDPVSSTRQEWSVMAVDDYGYGRIVVHNSTHLYYEQYSSIGKKVIDFLWIIKNRTVG